MICGVRIVAKLSRAGRKHKRNVATKDIQPGNYLIVTEGVETEKNYFENIGKIITDLFNNEVKVDKITLDVKGTGRSTSVLVNEVIKKRSLSSYSDVWVVFDRDNNTDFDEAIALATKEGFNVAWSNESFELWLLLHFQDLKAGIHRDNYIEKLNAHFKSKNINGGTYSKNINNIFDLTKPYVETAIKRSKALLEFHEENKNFNPNKMNPATKVQDLVEELIKYIKQKTQDL